MVSTDYVRNNAGNGIDGSALDVEDSRSEANDPDMRRRWEKIQSYTQRYQDVLARTGMADTNEARETFAWVRATQLTSRREVQASIVHREEFFEKYGMKIIEQGEPLLQTFEKLMTDARPFTSTQNQKEWLQRLHDNSLMSFEGKKYWIEHQLPEYIKRWKAVAQERDELVKNPKLKEAASQDKDIAVILDRERFLDLHYNERVNRIAKAKAYMMAMEKGRSPLFAAAEKKLKGAAFMHVLADHKIGMWLERIFKSKASEKKIDEFVNGTGPTSLGELIDRWTKVKFRFDMLKDKAEKLDQDAAARGLTIMSESQFLSMHFTQRLRYVEELDRRINGTGDINNTRPVFLQIRHAMDLKEWDDATDLIQRAKLMQLSEKEREQLQSMERFTKQFKPKEKTANGIDATEVRKRIDTIVGEIGEHHSEMQPMVLRLLKGPNANRSINQLRWMAYNEVWCETHGFAAYNVRKFGASKEHEISTRERAIRGEDVGRHNNIGHTTAGQHFLRKTEIVRHKATYEHLNVSDGSATQEIAEWCEHEQNPRDLYWRTLCCHVDGDPKSSNWHRDWFMRLTELRSLTRKLGGAGFRYGGQGLPLIPLN